MALSIPQKERTAAVGDVTGLVERAAKAMCASQLYASAWDGLKEGAQETYRTNTRAALLAALDPEDEAMVEHVAKRMIAARNHDDHRLAAFVLTWDREPALADARAAIAALKALAQGESVTPADNPLPDTPRRE